MQRTALRAAADAEHEAAHTHQSNFSRGAMVAFIFIVIIVFIIVLVIGKMWPSSSDATSIEREKERYQWKLQDIEKYNTSFYEAQSTHDKYKIMQDKYQFAYNNFHWESEVFEEIISQCRVLMKQSESEGDQRTWVELDKLIRQVKELNA